MEAKRNLIEGKAVNLAKQANIERQRRMKPVIKD